MSDAAIPVTRTDEPGTPTTTICFVSVATTTPSETTTSTTVIEVASTSPTPAEATTTTTIIDTVPCEPAPAVPLFRCVGQPLGGDGEWTYYEYCEPVGGPVPTTTIPPDATPAAPAPEVTASTSEVHATTTSILSPQP